MEIAPTTLDENLRFRREVYRMGGSKRDTQELWSLCARDPVFWVNTFVWTYDPRKEPAVIPLIMYPFQEKAFRDLLASFARHDVLIEKSRDMGATWVCLISFVWEFLFTEMHSFLATSRKEDLVDKSGDPDCLFWKIDFLLDRLPGWMCPPIMRNKLHIGNLMTGSVIDGESTTGDIARGGRRRAILLDEFASVENGEEVLASVQDAADSIIYNSTPKPMGTAFRDMARSEGMFKLRFHWTQHPTKSAGLYYSDGKPRSPWYDKQCKRRHARLVAQELDIDYDSSNYLFFDQRELDRIKARDTRRPYLVGELRHDENGNPLSFEETPHGRLSLWMHPDPITGKPADGSAYAVGIDVATGTGASNSCISVADRLTGEKVAAFVTPSIMPHRLAVEAAAIGRWFAGQGSDAYMMWEAQGPGRTFGDTLIELGYRNIYYHRRSDGGAPSVPGWFSTREGKTALLGEYMRDLGTKYINRCVAAIDECRQYVMMSNESVVHVSSVRNANPADTKGNHGDRVIADALCNRCIKQRPVRKDDVPVVIPVGCMAWRIQQAEEREREAAFW